MPNSKPEDKKLLDEMMEANSKNVTEAEMQVFDLYKQFMELHPNSTETFTPTLDAIRRWRYAVDNGRKRNDAERQTFKKLDDRSAKRLAESRAVGSFDRLPAMTKHKFMLLASHFPGRDVYALGSRITGEYIDADSPQKIHDMRADLLKKKTAVSDYDITLDFGPGDKIATLRKGLPSWADLVAKVPTGDRKIKIPMWNFSKLPTDIHAEVVDLVEKKQWGILMAIHNEYKLTDEYFCCDHGPAQRWFTYAVKQGIIKKTTTDEKP